jgi:hypothetical protein
MSFDPYREWFRIPPSKRVGDAPPDHYTLLGVPRFETDSSRIHEAALKRMQLLRSRQTGARAELTQRLMNEVSQARLCLTDAGRKAQYDFDLQQRLPAEPAFPAIERTGAPTWLMALAGVLLLGGGTATYLAVTRPRATDDVASVIEKPDSNRVQEPATGMEPPVPATTTATATPDIKKSKAPVSTKAAPDKSPPTTPRLRPFLVKLRNLPSSTVVRGSDADAIHCAETATDADDEDPTFLDREGRLLGFQRKVGGRTQFIVAERAADDQPFISEHLVQGLPDARLQGLAIEPDELSCIVATVEGKGLLQAKRPNKSSAWMEPTLILVADQTVKAAWPSMTADGRELYCVQQRSGKQHVLVLKRPSLEAPFKEPIVLPSLGPSFTQAAVSPNGKTLVLRGPDELYVSHRGNDDDWSKPEPVLSLRASAGPNRSLVLSPCFSPDGKWLWFASNRDGGAGGFDLWSAPTSLLAMQPPDLSKLTVKDGSKKKTSAKKEVINKKEAKAEKKSVGDAKKKPPVKVAPQPTPANDVPVRDSISEWLLLGPYPDATRETVKSTVDFDDFAGIELLRRMPKEGAKAVNDLVWKRASKFGAPGVYSVAIWLRIKTNADVRLLVESAPGGGVLWLDGEHSELAWRPGDVWMPLEGKRSGESVSLIAGRHRLVGIVCVADPSKPLVVRLVDGDDGTTLEGVSVGY